MRKNASLIEERSQIDNTTTRGLLGQILNNKAKLIFILDCFDLLQLAKCGRLQNLTFRNHRFDFNGFNFFSYSNVLKKQRMQFIQFDSHIKVSIPNFNQVTYNFTSNRIASLFFVCELDSYARAEMRSNLTKKLQAQPTTLCFSNL